jgi:site-specific DNA-methyltransferase (adenine-specific)
MNPPYGRGIERWVAKALESSQRGATVVCLLPARVDAAWFHDFVWQQAEVRFPRGRLKFRGFAGRGTAHGQFAPFPCVIAVFRPAGWAAGAGVCEMCSQRQMGKTPNIVLGDTPTKAQPKDSSE